MSALDSLLEQTASRHSHLCPRQVLGVRLGLEGLRLLDLDAPRNDKRLLVILETDGCFADGVEVATGCTVGHRTLRVVDYGKIAATFVDTKTGEAVRLAPRRDVRQRAYAHAPQEKRHYFAQLQAYQVMPDEELFTFAAVQLTTSIAEILSRAGVHTNCSACGEEIINQREILIDGAPYCLSCAQGGYYRPVVAALWPAVVEEPDHAPVLLVGRSFPGPQSPGTDCQLRTGLVGETVY